MFSRVGDERGRGARAGRSLAARVASSPASGRSSSGLRVAVALRIGERILDLGQVVVDQIELCCSKVLFEPVQLGHAGDRHDPRLLSEHPGEGDLRTGRALALGGLATGSPAPWDVDTVTAR
jgi:hypothetical protein